MRSPGGVYAVDSAQNETLVQRLVAAYPVKIVALAAAAMWLVLVVSGWVGAWGSVGWLLLIALLIALSLWADPPLGAWRRWPVVAADLGLVGRRGGVPARLLVLPTRERGAVLVVSADAHAPEAWRTAAPLLAQAMGFAHGQVVIAGRRVKITLSHGGGALAERHILPPQLDGQKVLVGIGEAGQPVWLDTDEHSGMVVAGVPGSGKTVFLRRMAATFAQKQKNSVHIFDGKGTDDFSDMARASAKISVYSGTPERAENGALVALRALHAEMHRRAKSHQKSAGRILIIIDESHGYMPVRGLTGADKAAREEAARIVRDLVALGRSLGMLTVLATQKPDAESLPTVIRDNCGLRACGRLRTAEAEKMALGISTGEALTLQRGQMLIDDGAEIVRVKVALLP